MRAEAVDLGEAERAGGGEGRVRLDRDAEAERAVTEIVRLAPTSEGIETAAQLWTMFGEPDRAAALRQRWRGGGSRR